MAGTQWVVYFKISGTPGQTRTASFHVRSVVGYPVSLPGHFPLTDQNRNWTLGPIASCRTSFRRRDKSMNQRVKETLETNNVV